LSSRELDKAYRFEKNNHSFETERLETSPKERERENVLKGEKESTSPKGGKIKNELHA
jgi:hypothetical protein